MAAKVHMTLWKFVPNYQGIMIPVLLVDGEWIRNNLDVGFIGGGHDLVDKYIGYAGPAIWIEKVFSKLDRAAFLVHELHERDLMGGKKMTYDPAHDDSNIVECLYRKSIGGKPAVRTEGNT